MRIPHALRVDAGPEHYAELLAALGADGLRFGWLEWEEPEPLPEPLRQAAAAGALRAVAVGRQLAVAVKPRKGPPVVRDLVREHFQGCAVVFVRGAGAGQGPVLRAEGRGEQGWQVTFDTGGTADYSTDALIARLRSPRPLDRPRVEARI